MKKFAIGIGLLIVVAIIIGSMSTRREDFTTRFEVGTKDNIIQIKHRIDTTEMKTYTDKVYGVKVQYPAFFNVLDTMEAGTARFSYPDKEIGVRLSMFAEPNVEGWTVKEAVKHLTDSLTFCVKEGKDFFILKGTIGQESSGAYLEKCFLSGDNWIDYTLFYGTEYENAIERLKEMIRKWHPELKLW